ncbi:MAG TPA: MBL fold metallo-hydrolase RNA specificity domain-containing protein, partial [Opitutales bacterium]|nr:MBL fold metallo-hydrolase RNA specificity domain-containing protein [Opitutales bacterium]
YGLSGHADREELLKLVEGMEPEAVVLTHGDTEARSWFKEHLAQHDASCKVLDPEPGRTYEV